MLFWKVTVMLSALDRAVVTRVEKTSVRTPVVPEPLVTSASLLYVFPWLSAHETVPEAGSIATVTITPWPTATLPASGVMEIVVPAGCWQVALVPLQMSRVQTLPSSVHAVPFALKASLGQVVLAPVQLSATSHSPAAARHTAPGFPAGC